MTINANGMFQSTPPRGGRLPSCLRIISSIRFQSTPPRGGRHAAYAQVVPFLKFQSTPPRGGRPARRYADATIKELFQSTPPRGGRPGRCRWAAPGIVSIHAPAWGATLVIPRHFGRQVSSFNPRPRVGGDSPGRPFTGTLRSFNPRPRVGGDLISRRAPRPDSFCFNPRPRVGGDLLSPRESRCRVRFNPRPRVGGDRRKA